MHQPLDDDPILGLALGFNRTFMDCETSEDMANRKPRTVVLHFNGNNVAGLIGNAAKGVVRQAKKEGRNVKPGEAANAAATTPEAFTGTVVLCPN